MAINQLPLPPVVTAMTNKLCSYQFLLAFLLAAPASAQSSRRTLPNQPIPLPPTILPSQPNPLPKPAPTLPTPPPASNIDRIKVLRYQIVGSSVFNNTELTRLTQPYTGLVSFDQIQAAKQAIEQYYIDRQYLTSGAYIPTDQTLSIDGAVVKIQIIEGQLEDIKITGTHRLNNNYIKSRLALATQRPLNNEKLLEGLRLLQQDPLIANISAELSSGIQPGTNLLEMVIWVGCMSELVNGLRHYVLPNKPWL
jgi:hemolysin activation/secretion protein